MTHHTDPLPGNRQADLPFQLDDLFLGTLVRLSALGGKDYQETYARWTNDAEFLRNYQFGIALPRTVGFMERREKKELENNGKSEFNFTIRTLADNKLIGEGGLEPDWNHQTGWFWIGIGEPDYRNKGYGTDATRLFINYGFRELGLHRITLSVFSGNPRAKRVYEKIGFQTEAVQRQNLYRDGQRMDVIYMGLLRREWEAGLNTQVR